MSTIKEAMVNLVYPDEIKTKLMKISKLIKFLCPIYKIMRNRSKAKLLFTDMELLFEVTWINRDRD